MANDKLPAFIRVLLQNRSGQQHNLVPTQHLVVDVSAVDFTFSGKNGNFLYVLTSGNLEISLIGDSSSFIIPVVAGQEIHMAVKTVYNANTTATVVGLD